MIHLLRGLIPSSSPLRKAYSAGKAQLAALINGFPAKGYTIVAITGTDGKTTTTQMLMHILLKQEMRVISASSSEVRYGEEVMHSKRSTPSPFLLQRLLKRGRSDGYTHLILETTSHALEQRRTSGIRPDVAVLTTLTSEHLDYHKTLEQYHAAKALLFLRDLKPQGAAVLPTGISFEQEVREQGKTVITYASAEGEQKPSYRVKSLPTAEGVKYQVEPGGHEGTLGVMGGYNAHNALAAILAAEQIGVSQEESVEALKSFRGVAGRMQEVKCGQPYRVFVDYAISLDAYKTVLSSLREMISDPSGRILIVYGGYGGQPDHEKRYEMGALTAKMADVLIVTDEEPYEENPALIRKDIIEGVKATLTEEQCHERLREIGDRRQALENALQEARPQDIVIAMGMGELQSRNIGGKEVPWDEVEVIRDILEHPHMASSDKA